MAKKSKTHAGGKTPNFEHALEELEAVVHELEHGELGLAEALQRYELGVKRLRQCQKLLEQAEERIEVLTRVDAEGNPVTRAFSTEQRPSQSVKTKRRKPSTRTASTSESDKLSNRGRSARRARPDSMEPDAPFEEESREDTEFLEGTEPFDDDGGLENELF
ncbi:MAG: exodeoxyribonuclease VII small subunit [Pirellulales bacterium]|nr:exodeoxyribonuclease VII small subunit [Pirellulales bacterium]